MAAPKPLPGPKGPVTGREVIVWQPPRDRPEGIAQAAHEAKLAKARAAEMAAREALAMARIKMQNARGVIADLVLREMQKYLRMSELPDFANTTGPLTPELILKLAEWVSKEDRLDTGKSTENIAHTIGPSLDFSRLTQEERDAWRALALKGGAPEE